MTSSGPGGGPIGEPFTLLEIIMRTTAHAADAALYVEACREFGSFSRMNWFEHRPENRPEHRFSLSPEERERIGHNHRQRYERLRAIEEILVGELRGRVLSGELILSGFLGGCPLAATPTAIHPSLVKTYRINPAERMLISGQRTFTEVFAQFTSHSAKRVLSVGQQRQLCTQFISALGSEERRSQDRAADLCYAHFLAMGIKVQKGTAKAVAKEVLGNRVGRPKKIGE